MEFRSFGRIPFPERVKLDVQRIRDYYEQGLISKELAAKYISDIEKDLRKLQGLVPSDDFSEFRINEATEVSAVDYEKLKQWQEERAKMSQSQWKREMYGSWIEEEGKNE